jgi:hypothetical protein
MICISSDSISVFRENGEEMRFLFSDSEEEEKSSKSKESEPKKKSKLSRRKLARLEKKTVKILQEIDPEAKLPRVAKPSRSKDLSKSSRISQEVGDEVSNFSEEEDEEEMNEEELSKEEGEEMNDADAAEVVEEENDEVVPVELIFQEDDGEPYDEVKNTLKESELREPEELENGTEELEYDTGDNSLPSDLPQDSISLGMVYVLINISDFFRQISSFEETVRDTYYQLEENEMESRHLKLLDIERMCSSLTLNITQKIEELNAEEKNLKNQILRLTIVLLQAEDILNRSSNPKESSKLTENTVKETQKIHDKTRETIHEVNLAILKVRDTVEELISNYTTTLSELHQI